MSSALYDSPEFAAAVRTVLGGDLMLLPETFMDYTVQYAAMNPLSIPVSQLTGFSQFTVLVGNYVNNQESTSSSTYTDLTTVGPTLSAVPDGHYIIAFGCEAFISTAGYGARMSIQVNSTAAGNADECVTAATTLGSIMRITTKTLQNSNNSTLTCKYLADATSHTGTFGKRWMIALKYGNL